MAAAAAADGMELRLAGHFPLVHKSCKKPAAKFFDCFSEKANQPPDGVSKPLFSPHSSRLTTGSNTHTAVYLLG